MTAGAAGQPAEVRPDGAAYWAGLKARAAVLVLLGAIAIWRLATSSYSVGTLVVIVALVVVAAAGSALGVWLHLSRSVVRLLPDAIVRESPVLPTREVRLGQGLRGGLLTAKRPLQPDTRLLVLVAADGTRLRMGGDYWAEAGLARVLGHSRVAPVADRTYKGRELETAVPGSTTFQERNPWLVAVVGTVVAVVVLLALILLYFEIADVQY